MSYTVILEKGVEKFIKAQSKPQARRVLDALLGLEEEPRPANCTKLVGAENEYRLRIGSIRILYTIDDETVTVVAFKAGYRGDVYK